MLDRQMVSPQDREWARRALDGDTAKVASVLKSRFSAQNILRFGTAVKRWSWGCRGSRNAPMIGHQSDKQILQG